MEEQEARKADNLRHIALGEDPYAPRGGAKAKTLSKKKALPANRSEVAPATKHKVTQGKGRGKRIGKNASHRVVSDEPVLESEPATVSLS